MCSAVSVTRTWTSSRIASSKVRMVPIISTESGMMFLRTPPLMRPTVTTAGSLRDVDLAADDGLQAEHDLRGDDDRVDAAPRHRAVRLPAVDDDAKGVGAGHRRARAVADRAGRQLRRHVQAEDRVGRRVLEHALLDHQLRAALLAFGRQSPRRAGR